MRLSANIGSSIDDLRSESVPSSVHRQTNWTLIFRGARRVFCAIAIAAFPTLPSRSVLAEPASHSEYTSLDRDCKISPAVRRG